MSRPGEPAPPPVATVPDEWFRMTPLELASGMIRGIDPRTGPLPRAPAGLTARAALERAILPALQRPPCVVSFSGGRDSSAVLAVAVHVARREGLPMPVPVSQRFPEWEAADESSWQEMVVRHLGITDWVTRVFTDELDVLGPYAQSVLRRHGLLWPFNAHFHLPVIEQAPGGSLLTGFGGDELLTPVQLWRRVSRLRAGEVRWEPRDALRLAAAYGPMPLRRAAARRHLRGSPPRAWLRPAAAARVTAAAVADLALEPVRWDHAIERAWWPRRYLSVFRSTRAMVAGMHDVVPHDPLTDGVFLAAFAREGGRRGFLTRTAATHHLAGDLLPEELVARSSKAELGGAFWNRHARAFAAGWDGSGLDRSVVDVEELHRIWTADGPPDGRTKSLLQAAWLASADTPAG